MFLAQAYIGPYRKSFDNYKEAAEHANKLAAEENQPYLVYELILRLMARVKT